MIEGSGSVTLLSDPDPDPMCPDPDPYPQHWLEHVRTWPNMSEYKINFPLVISRSFLWHTVPKGSTPVYNSIRFILIYFQIFSGCVRTSLLKSDFDSMLNVYWLETSEDDQ